MSFHVTPLELDRAAARLGELADGARRAVAHVEAHAHVGDAPFGAGREAADAVTHARGVLRDHEARVADLLDAAGRTLAANAAAYRAADDDARRRGRAVDLLLRAVS